MHRTEAGDWVWSSDSEADGEDHSDGDSDAEATCRHDAVAQAAPVQVNPATETQHSGSSTGSNISGSTSGSNTSDQTAASLLQQQPEQQAEVASMTPTPVVADSVSQSPPPASVTSESQPINLVLRMRFNSSLLLFVVFPGIHRFYILEIIHEVTKIRFPENLAVIHEKSRVKGQEVGNPYATSTIFSRFCTNRMEPTHSGSSETYGIRLHFLAAPFTSL